MKTQIYQCESCGRYTQDYYSEYGWIHIDNLNGLIISGGRESDGEATPITFVKGLVVLDNAENIKGSIDFCSIICMLKYLFESEKTSNHLKARDMNNLAYNEYKGIALLCEFDIDPDG